MDKMIILDIETRELDVEIGGIYEVSMIAVENYEVKDSIHIGIVENENEISLGYGYGYEDLSYNEDKINKFKSFIEKYNYPLVAHNANFDRKFLVHYNWLDETHILYDSIKAIKLEWPNLFSYSLGYLLEIFDVNENQDHTAINDTLQLLEVLRKANPKNWIPLGITTRSKSVEYKYEVDKDMITVENDYFKGQNIVFTGKGDYERKYLKALAVTYGANVIDSVTKKADILVVGENAGSKLKKATDLGIEILSMDDFMDIVEMDFTVVNKLDKCIIKSSKTNGLKKEGFNLDKPHLEGKLISLVPMKLKMAEKIGKIINTLGGNYITTFRQAETDLLIYQTYGEDFPTVIKAKKLNIPTLRLSDLNKLLLEDKMSEIFY